MATLAELELRIKSLEAVKAEKNLNKLTGASKKTAASTKKLEKNVKSQENATKKLNKSYEDMGRKLKQLAIGIGGLLILRQVTTVFAEFEQTMAEVGGVSGATAKQFSQLTAQARELGAVTRFSARQAAEAQLALSRAGFSVNETLRTSAAVLNLASAAQLELGRAAEITAITMRQFGLAATDSVMITDILVNTANSATTNVEGLAQALKFTGSIASSFGKSLSSVAAAIGVVADAGLDASQAGTGLRGVFSRLGDPIGKAAKVLDKLSSRLGKTRKLFDITENSLADIFQAFKDAGASTQDFIRIFGRLQAPAALALVANVEKIRELTEANDKAAGTTAELARVMEDTLKGSLLSAKSAVEELFIEIGDSRLGGGFRALADVFAGATLFLSNFQGESDKMTTTARLLAGAIELVVGSLVAYGGRLVVIKLLTFAARAGTLGFIATLRTMKVAIASTGIGLLLVLVAELALAFSNLDDSTGKSVKQLRDLEKSQRASAEATREQIRELAELDKQRIQGQGNLQTLADRFNAAVKKQRQLQAGLSESQIKALDEEEKLTQFALQAARDKLQVDELNETQRARTLVGVKNLLAAEKDAARLAEQLGGSDKKKNKALDEQIKKQQDLAAFQGARELAVESSGLSAARVQVERLESEFEKLFLSAKGVADVMDLSDIDNDEFLRGLDLISEQQRKIAGKDALKRVLSDGESAAKTLDAALQGVTNQLELMNVSVENRELVKAQQEFKKAIDAATVSLETQLNDGLIGADEFIKSIGELNTKLVDTAKIRALLPLIEDGKQAEQGMIDLAASIQAASTPLVEFEQLAEKSIEGYRAQLAAGVISQDQFNKKLLETNDAIALFGQNLQQIETIEKLGAVAEGLVDSFQSFFDTIVTGSKTAGEAALDLFREISKLASRKLAVEPLINALKAGIGSAVGAAAGSSTGVGFFGSAKGNAFNNGGLQAFAKGGIIGGPTIFPLGIAGEAGPEAILPLKRDSSGNLGVAQVDSRPQRRATLTRPFVNASVSTGASSAPSRQESDRGGTRIINQQVNVSSLDANAFRQSSAQIQSDMARAARFVKF